MLYCRRNYDRYLLDGGRNAVHTDNDLGQIFAEIDHTARCSYLDQHLRSSEVPTFFTRILYYMMRSRSVSKEQIRLYAVATTLIQMALNVHETVSTDKEVTGAEMHFRQLSVLAGDYYSGLFYRNLAEAGEVAGIACLSGAICDVNEAKMDLYGIQGKSNISWFRYTQLAMRVQGGLINALARFFCENREESDSWDVLGGYMMLLYNWSQNPVKADSPMGPVPVETIRSVAAESLRLSKQVPSLEVRQDLLTLIQNCVGIHSEEELHVCEG